MKNWRDYVGYQTGAAIRPIGMSQPNRLRVMFFKAKLNGVATALSIEKVDIPLEEVNLTDKEVGVEVERLLNTFTRRSTSDPIDIERARFGVAKRTVRAPANTNFGRVWFYNGSSAPDAPIIVTDYQGKFAIFQHPDFDDYGFIIDE